MNWVVFFAVLVVIPAAACIGCLAAYAITHAVYWWVRASDGAKAAIEVAALTAMVVGCATAAGLVIP